MSVLRSLTVQILQNEAFTFSDARRSFPLHLPDSRPIKSPTVRNCSRRHGKTVPRAIFLLATPPTLANDHTAPALTSTEKLCLSIEQFTKPEAVREAAGPRAVQPVRRSGRLSQSQWWSSENHFGPIGQFQKIHASNVGSLPRSFGKSRRPPQAGSRPRNGWMAAILGLWRVGPGNEANTQVPGRRAGRTLR